MHGFCILATLQKLLLHFPALWLLFMHKRWLWFTWTEGLPHIWQNPCLAAAAAKSLQLCPTLCDPRDGSPPGSPVPGILQARTLEWVAISFSNAWKWKVKVKLLSRVHVLRSIKNTSPLGVETRESSYTVGGNVNRCSHFLKYRRSFKN